VTLFALIFSLAYSPSKFSSKKKTMQAISVFGVGCALGITLLFLLPETVCTILASVIDPLTGKAPKITTIQLGLAFSLGFVGMFLLEELCAKLTTRDDSNSNYHKLAGDQAGTSQPENKVL
jgi:hypothetical protein